MILNTSDVVTILAPDGTIGVPEPVSGEGLGILRRRAQRDERAPAHPPRGP